MKRKIYLPLAILALFFSGCVVYSFYPLYTEKDLFANDILTGEWFESEDQSVKFNEDEEVWNFVHPYVDNNNKEQDSCGYVLTLRSKENGEEITSTFLVTIIKLSGQYFLDFYLKDYPNNGEFQLSTFHVIPVHTFAKLEVEEDVLKIRWFDPDWLEDLIRENKIRIHHEANDEFILLTAKPQELQKFVTKYVNSEEAFEDGLEVVLHRKK
ncbi:MAG: hypothetical protein ACK5M7_20280 [Draconibacterium sp.]